MIQAAQQEEAILRVWLHDHARIDDYIHVHLGFTVTPTMATVHCGTHVCFSLHNDVTECDICILRSVMAREDQVCW